MGSGKVRVLISALVIAKVRCQCQTVPTIDGTASPEPCIFPFDYDGFHFDSCTAIGDGSDRVWCSVAVNEFGEHITGQGRWGHCDLLTCEGLWSKGPSQRENTQCRTFAGFRPNRPCVFPFILKDKIYNTCTTDLDENEELWCSTRVDSSGNHVTGEWGYCTCDDNLTGSVLEECPNSERSFISNVPIRGNYIPSLNECGQPLDNRFVTGGKAASVEEFSFAALVGYESFDNHIRFGCGGVLINRRYVLTAAHCVEFDAPKIVRLGELVVGRECDCTPDESRCARRVQDIDIERIITHEAYSRRDSFKNDITLLRLARPVVLSSSVGVVCLPIGAPFKGNLDGNLVTVVGWGRIKYDQPGAFQTLGVINRELQKAKFPIVSNFACNKVWSGKIREEIQICGGGPKTDSCKGDSGGPLVMENKSGQYGLVGLVSFGKSTCGDGDPGVYTRVEHFLPWIERNLRP